MGDVANFNQTRIIAGREGVAVRLGSIGRECLSLDVGVPEGLGFLRNTIEGLVGACVRENGISMCVACRSCALSGKTLGCGERLTSRCVAYLGRVRRSFSLSCSVGIDALSHCPRMLIVRRRSISRRTL